MVKKDKFLKNDYVIIKEGFADFYVHSDDISSIPSKSMKVFYNKKMEINRDASCLAINAYNNLFNQNNLIIVDSMAASGISSIRMIKECNNIKKIFINDINPVAVDLIHKNIKLNNIIGPKIIISQKDTNLLFSEIAQNTYPHFKNSQERPNIISIDPFGTPNLYIDSAFKAIQKTNGLMCITATDTAVLFGVRPNACVRKYMSKPLRNEYGKEIGARILIYFISRIANINKLAIIPFLTFYSNHFIRVFALTLKNKKDILNYIKNYGFIIHCNNCGYRSIHQTNIIAIQIECPLCREKGKLDYAGPLWIGEIHDMAYLKEILNLNKESNYSNKKKLNKIFLFALNEINMPVSYYNIHKLCQILKLQKVPNMQKILSLIKKQGYKASRTHFDFTSIKTDMNINLLKELLLEKYK
ncbi:MAG: tRNA (guanine(10)-N(2))-dimethyltransferase [Promethearchaeota archaeon]